MGSYVEGQLIPGEEVRQAANVSYMSQLGWFLVALFLIAALLLVPHAALAIVSLVVIPLALVIVLVAVIRVRSVQLVITNKKVLGKRGVFSRQTIDIPLQKVESIKVDQSVAGRLFGYGDVQIAGTGGDRILLPFIADAMGFKKVVMASLDGLQR
jgi:uncharacterized membrane protein YdbT with pleckstrin-like domain